MDDGCFCHPYTHITDPTGKRVVEQPSGSSSPPSATYAYGSASSFHPRSNPTRSMTPSSSFFLVAGGADVSPSTPSICLPGLPTRPPPLQRLPRPGPPPLCNPSRTRPPSSNHRPLPPLPTRQSTSYSRAPPSHPCVSVKLGWSVSGVVGSDGKAGRDESGCLTIEVATAVVVVGRHGGSLASSSSQGRCVTAAAAIWVW